MAGQAGTGMNGAVAAATLRQAWQRYLEAHLIRKNRSEKTIGGYRDHVERLFSEWLGTSLLDLANDPGRVAERHDQLTKESGPYMANGSMDAAGNLQSCAEDKSIAGRRTASPSSRTLTRPMESVWGGTWSWFLQGFLIARPKKTDKLS